MSEMSPDSEGGSQRGRACCYWRRKAGLLVLMFLLSLALVIGVVLLRAGNLRLHEPGCGVSPVKANLRLLHTAVNQFHMDSGRWPTQAEGLTVLVRRPADAVNWQPGGYLETPEVPNDLWGRDYIYELRPSSGRPFVIKCLGADGVPGGDGDDADLSSVP